MTDLWDFTGDVNPRAEITRVAPRKATPRVIAFRGGFPELPKGPWDTPPPSTSIVSQPSAGLVPDATRRTLTAHGANGIIPVIFGGPLSTGGLIIYGPVQSGSFVYIDFLICEGSAESITGLEATKTFADLGLVSGTHYNIHLGVAGDTTDAIIQEYLTAHSLGTYVVPEYTARVSCKFPTPNTTTGNYSPLEFKCIVKGLLCYDPRIPGYPSTATKNPILHIREALTNARWGMGDTIPAANEVWFTDAANLCDTDIDPTATVTPRWESCLKFDRDAPFQQAMETLRAHGFAVMVYDEGWKVFVDAARSSTGITLVDHADDTSDINCERVTVETVGTEEVPTVIFVDFTNSEDTFRDDWVQYPDPFPGGEWREQRFQLRGIMTRERARRAARQIFKRLQHDLRANTETIQVGFKLEPGDRVGVISTRLLGDSAEEFQITDLKENDGTWSAAFEIYDEDDYDDTINVTGPGPVPAPPEPGTIPPSTTGSGTFEGTLPIVWCETPAGTINGVNGDFTLSRVPLAGGLLRRGTIVLHEGCHYTISGAAIHVEDAYVPIVDDDFCYTYNRPSP
jgi:hypothetical protein